MRSVSSHHQDCGPGYCTKVRFLVLTLLAFAAAAHAVDYPPIARYSDAETGIRTISFDTTQDARGVLYFASTSLLTFDGDRWKSFPIPDAYAIRRLHFGPDGRLWAAAIGDLGWFEQTPDLNWVFHSLRSKLPADHANLGDVWGVAADKTGATFVTRDRILRWDGQKFAVWEKPGASKLYPLRTADAFYVHHLETGLYEVDASGPKMLIDRATLDRAMPEGTMPGPVAVIWVERRASDWLFGTNRGFFVFDGETMKPFAPGITNFITTSKFSQAYRLRDGRIAVGTVTGGMAFLLSTGEIDTFLGVTEGTSSPPINSFLSGRDGELWVTTGSHILRIDVQAHSTVFDERAGLPAQAIRKISTFGQRLVIANESGLLQLPPGSDRFVPIDSFNGRWQDIRETVHGLVISGFLGSRIWDGRNVTFLHRTKGDVFATLPARHKPDEIYLADNRTLVSARPGSEPRQLVQDLPDFITSIVEDERGLLWVGTLARGVWIGNPTTGTSIEAAATTEKFGLPKQLGPTNVRAGSTGEIFVFANNGAWYKATASNFSPVENYLPGGIAAVSEVGPDGAIWVVNEGTPQAAPRVGRISLRGAQAVWEPHAVDELAEVGIPRSLFVQTDTNRESILWIGGTRALLRHKVDLTSSIPPPRAPLLRAFARLDANSRQSPIESALPYTTDAIEFEFAAPEFSRRPLLRIETRIDGLNSEWKPTGAGSVLHLAGLRDGKYTLRAHVVAETGATSKETSFSFTVLPPWWRTTPSLLGGALALVPLAYGFYWLRVRTLRRRNLELEEKVRRRTEELEAASAAKTQFVANMSHDIRNPLNGIVGLTIAIEDTRLSARQRELVATLRECTTYLSSLVDDVLDFASIESGRVELRPTAFSPPELLRSIVETMKADATESGALLSVEVDSGVPSHLFGDAGRIQQILVNFVSNALKYAGGVIRLSVRLPANAPGEVEFTVTDQGPGISPAEQATLFTKFSRLKQTRGGEEIPGAGLGLASCRLLADSMGGSVGIASEVGCGAQFFLRLPVAVTTAPVPVPAQNLPNTTVLLVEDTDYNAWAASAVLARLGLSCERARTGQEALRLFSEKRFNVVLLDRNLPDMDGTEVARKMRETGSDGLQAVILAVTAYCTAEDRALCLQSGMDAFVGKPLTPEKLRRVLLEAGRSLLTATSVQVPEAAPKTGLDTALLAYLSDGSQAGLDAQIQRFLETLDETEKQMSVALASSDHARLATQAHQLLGQAKMVGSTTLAAAASHLEAAAQSCDGPACAEWLQRVGAEISSLTEAIRHLPPTVTPT